ncbi:hypothetical protein CPC08DRAFT_766265 [Agrocybe pediades]|nr:hypothetical protein CPC08DRAFT_766265 [Agrocybe pediades]
MPKDLSPAASFLSSLAPQWTAPRCPNNHYPTTGISMGQKRPEEIGMRLCHCIKHRYRVSNNQPLCASSTGPLVKEPERSRLRAALTAFKLAKKEKRSDEEAKALGCQAYRDFKPTTLETTLASSESNSDVAPSSSTSTLARPILEGQGKFVDIYVYIHADDNYITHQGNIINNEYPFASDKALHDIIDFPASEWSIYDRYRERFIPLHTFTSGLEITPGEFIIIRSLEFEDRDCTGLKQLLLRLQVPPIGSSSSKALGKRKRHADSITDKKARPFNRRRSNEPAKVYLGCIELTDSD